MSKKINLILIALFFSFIGYAQRTITGVVTNSSGDLLPGVTVLVKGTTIGTITGFDGDYEIKVPINKNYLVFSYIGMTPQEIEIKDQSKIDVQLADSSNQLDEVVVIGYGTVRKSDLTGSVSSIKSDEIAQSQATNFMDAMQGRMAGVNITSALGPSFLT